MRKVRNQKNIISLYLLLATLYSLFLTSCATVPYKKFGYTPSAYLKIDDFCKKYNFDYEFDTFDDTIRIFSKDSEIQVLLNSYAGFLNGESFSLKNVPVYINGMIYIPHEIEKIISTPRPRFISKQSLAIKKIVIDPGHGGKDPGAISPRGLKEKDLNLKVAKYLQNALEEKGFNVFLTRSSDIYLTLEQRVRFAKKHNADLFVSIHSNASTSHKLQGVEVYYLSPAKFDGHNRAVSLARKEGFADYNLSSDANAILWDLVLSSNYSLSIEFSNMLYRTFKNMGFNVKSPKKAGFYVLKNAYVPSVLVEMGYLTNHYEEKTLKKEYYQKQIAESIALGVLSLEKRNQLVGGE